MSKIDYFTLLEKKKFPNITVKVISPKTKESIQIKCHKCVLSQSPYLEKRIVEDVIEEKDEINFDSLKYIINWFYGISKAPKKSIDLKKVLSFAKKWEMKELFHYIATLSKSPLSEEEKNFVKDADKKKKCNELLGDHIYTKLFTEFQNGGKKTTSYCVYSNNGKKFYTHKEVFYVKSDYLRSIIDNDEKSVTLNLPDDATYLFLYFLYKEKMDVKLDLYSYTTFLELFKLAKRNKIVQLEKIALGCFEKSISKKNCFDCYISSYSDLKQNAPLTKLVLKHLLGCLGNNKELVKYFAESVKTEKEKIGRLASLGQESKELEEYKRAVVREENKIKHDLEIRRKDLNQKKKKLNETGEKLESDIEDLTVTNQKNQQRIQTLGSKFKKESLLKQKEERLKTLSDNPQKHKDEIIDLQDNITQLRGDIFVYDDKHKRYFLELQKTEKRLIEKFDMKEKLRIERELLNDLEEQLDFNQRKFREILNTDYSEEERKRMMEKKKLEGSKGNKKEQKRIEKEQKKKEKEMKKEQKKKEKEIKKVQKKKEQQKKKEVPKIATKVLPKESPKESPKEPPKKPDVRKKPPQLPSKKKPEN